MDLCAIITANYLPEARVMLRSYREHNPNGRIFVLIVDPLPAGLDLLLPPCTVLTPDVLGIQNLDALRMQYTAYEITSALRPTFLLHLLQKEGIERLLFLDADMLVAGTFHAVDKLLEQHDIILTPSTLSPIPDDGKNPSERDILSTGTYNGGFFACRRSEHTEEMLSWLESRLARYCFHRLQDNFFGDQKWLDLLPSFLPSTAIMRDPGYNVAVWNLHERTLSTQGTTYSVNGRPLTCFHFSGFRPNNPLQLSVHQNRFDLRQEPALAALATTYATALTDAGYETLHPLPYAFDRFENGVLVSPILRRIFVENGGESRFRNPFGVGEGSFFEWLIKRPLGAAKGILRVHLEIHRLSIEASARFPAPTTTDAPLFAQWLLGASQRKRFDLDTAFTESPASLAATAPDASIAERVRERIRRRHTYAPYQFLCRMGRTILGDRRYEKLKPKANALELSRDGLKPLGNLAEDTSVR